MFLVRLFTVANMNTVLFYSLTGLINGGLSSENNHKKCIQYIQYIQYMQYTPAIGLILSYEVVNFAALVWYVLPEHDFDTVSWMLWRNKLYALPSSNTGRRTVCLSNGNAITNLNQ